MGSAVRLFRNAVLSGAGDVRRTPLLEHSLGERALLGLVDMHGHQNAATHELLFVLPRFMLPGAHFDEGRGDAARACANPLPAQRRQDRP